MIKETDFLPFSLSYQKKVLYLHIHSMVVWIKLK